MNHDLQKCPECQGKTIEFKGAGSDLQYKICSKAYTDPERHLTETQMRELYQQRVSVHMPKSGRFG